LNYKSNNILVDILYYNIYDHIMVYLVNILNNMMNSLNIKCIHYHIFHIYYLNSRVNNMSHHICQHKHYLNIYNSQNIYHKLEYYLQVNNFYNCLNIINI